jgi:predicted dehydrogenase
LLHSAGFDVEDLYYAILNFENGTLGMAELGWHVPPGASAARISGVTVVGTRGVISVQQGQTGIEAWSDGGYLPTDTTFWPEAYDVPGGALSLEIRHFADCIRKDSAPAISLEDAIEALRLSLAMQLSAESGLPVNLREFGRS